MPALTRLRLSRRQTASLFTRFWFSWMAASRSVVPTCRGAFISDLNCRKGRPSVGAHASDAKDVYNAITAFQRVTMFAGEFIFFIWASPRFHALVARTAMILLFGILGCASRTPIDRAAILNKSVTKQVRSLNRFSRLSGVEDEQGQLTQATMEFTRDIGLVHDCLRDRGGIENPICRFDAREVEHRTEWITASSGRLEEDVFHSTKASDRTKRKAKKAVTAIQAKTARIESTLGEGGLLIRRFSTAPPPPNMLKQLPPEVQTELRP